MLLGIDHLVVAVADPDEAAATMERDLGLAVSGGGRHADGGTFNRLAFLGDTYLELIGIADRSRVEAAGGPAIGRAALARLDADGEGLATYAVATDDANADVARLRAAGSPIGDAVAGSRIRPDGEVVRWVTALPALGPALSPFLIEHEPSGAEWGAEARAARAAFRHPGGGRVRLATLTIPVDDVAAATERYRRDVGADVAPDGVWPLGAQAIRLVSASAARGPVVDLEADPGTDPLDVIRFGIRWRRWPSATTMR